MISHYLSMGSILIFLGLLIFSAHLFAAIFKKKKLPDVLLLMVVGLILGPILGVVGTHDLGKVGPVFASITLVFILFDSGIDLNISTLKSCWRNLVGITFLSCFFSAVIVAVITWHFLGLSFLEALLLGSILAGTSSAVVIPLVKQLSVQEETKTVLILESALTDVICIVLALAFLESYKYGSLDVLRLFGKILSSFVMATLIGIIGGITWASLLERVRRIQHSIFLTPSFVFIVYGVSEVMDFSGAISALAFGVCIANTEYFEFPFIKKLNKGKIEKLNQEEKNLLSEVVFLLKTMFFVYIGISIPFDHSTALIYGVIISISLFVMRLLLTRFIISPKVQTFDKVVISMMIPKGLAAAVLATIPEQEGVPGGEIIKYVAYSVVFISILLTSLLILFSERYEKVRNLYKYFFEPKKSLQEPREDEMTEK